MSSGLKIDRREFDAAIRKYVGYSRREIPVIVNTKALYIARRAMIETPKADKAKVIAELKGSRLKNFTTKSGKQKQIQYTLAQLIVVARRVQKGLSTTKSDIAADVKAFIAGRVRSIAFLKSGWIPAIKTLTPLADRVGGPTAPRVTKSNSGTQYGRPKGKVSPAKESNGMKAVCTITNDALPNSHAGDFFSKIVHHFFPPNREQALQHVEPALQKAFDAETASMNEYVEKKLKQAAERAAIKTR